MYEHQQQTALLGTCLGYPLVQRFVARDRRKQGLELSGQIGSPPPVSGPPDKQQLVVIQPETLHEVFNSAR